MSDISPNGGAWSLPSRATTVFASRRLSNGFQSLNAAYCGFKHLQDGSFDGGITDQPRLVDAAVLAEDVAVQHGADSLFHAQDACIEVVAVGPARAGFGVSGSGYGRCRKPSAELLPFAWLRPLVRLEGGGGAAVAIPARRPHSFAPVLRQGPGEQRGCSHRLAVLIQIDPDGLDIVEVTAKTKARARPLEGLRVG